MIGQPISRLDGPVKVTGGATYAYEYLQDEAPLYGVIVTATIGRGHVREIDSSQARTIAGSCAIVTTKTSQLRAPAMNRTRCRFLTGAPVQLSPVLRWAITASPSHSWSPLRSCRLRPRTFVRVTYATEDGDLRLHG